MRQSIALLFALVVVGTAAAQTPWQGKNLQHFPRDIPRDALVQRMREFSFALGVRCEHCHDGSVSPTFDNFESDAKAPKLKARAMLRMVDELNTRLLAQVPARAEPRVEVTCATCHRGHALPKSLQTTLWEVVEREGAAAAVAKYRQLRRDEMVGGGFDFGEWEMNELARRLIEAGKREAAIAILEVNGEFNPRSSEIDFRLGELKLALGEREAALRHYKAALEKAPQHTRARQRILEIEGK